MDGKTMTFTFASEEDHALVKQTLGVIAERLRVSDTEALMFLARQAKAEIPATVGA
jgi:hypothetical protein